MKAAVHFSAVLIFTSILATSALANDVRLFVAKITYSDGDLIHPCFVLSEDIGKATDKIVKAVPNLTISGLVLMEWPIQKAKELGLDPNKPDDVVRIDRQLQWSPMLGLRPTWPLDTTSSGDASVGTPPVQGTKLDLPATPDLQGYVMLDGPDVLPGESAMDTHLRRQLEDLKSFPNGGRGSGQTHGMGD
jgi:hypothetical protein